MKPKKSNPKTNFTKKSSLKTAPNRSLYSTLATWKSVLVVSLALAWGAYIKSSSDKQDDSIGFIAKADTSIKYKTQNISCSADYKNYPVFPHCTPVKNCGYTVVDDIFTRNEIDTLQRLLLGGMAHGGSKGGASVLDLHSGALSKGDKFVNIYKYLDSDKLREILPSEDIAVFAAVKSKIHQSIAEHFGLERDRLTLTNPSFFSRMTPTPAQTDHDEYWHQHIDKIQYGSFDYTSLIYLADYGTDFTGGRFVFDNKDNAIIEPKAGRLVFFTSGSENPHHVEKVLSGTRLAFTVAFTCDKKKGIKPPYNKFLTM